MSNDSNFIQPDDFATNGSLNDINDTALPDNMVLSAVQQACNFFGIPEVPVVNAQGTCVWSNDPSTYDDDVLGFNREELMSMELVARIH